MNAKYLVYSFDVFDTCISRTYEKPTDLFFHLGLQIAPSFTDMSLAEGFAESFMNARILAEKKAHKAQGRKKSCKMYEIYSLLELPNYCTHSKKEIMDLEKELEYDASYGIERIKTIIFNLRKENHRIVFISDMYLDKEFVKKLLVKNGLFKDGDNIYVSSDNYLTKRSGELYKFLLRNENIKAEELLHHGDNKYSDIRAAQKIGINTVHIDFTCIQPHEIVFSSQKFNPQIRRLNSIPKFIRLKKVQQMENNQLNFFSKIAPILVAFTSWTIVEASKKSIKRLYFSARDGELPFKIAKLLCKNKEIQINFLYGSRKAWLLPSINIDDEQWKIIAAPKKEESSIKDCLERLGFSDIEIRNLGKKIISPVSDLDYKFSSDVCIKKINELLNNKEFIKIFKEKIDDERSYCKDYLVQEGIFDTTSWAIVDSGWTLKTQASLRRIIESNEKSISIRGLYFGLSPNCLSDVDAGEAIAFIAERKFFYQKAIVIENCLFPSTLETTVGYKRNGTRLEPIFNITDRKNEDKEFSKNLHKYVCEYVYAVIGLNIDYNFFNANRLYLIKNLKILLEHPKKEVAELFSQFSVDFDIRHTNKNKIRMIKAVSLGDIKKIILGTFNIMHSEFHFWPEASAEISRSIPKILLKFLLFINKFLNRSNKKYVRHNGETKQ